jgi:hypothetical protein
VNKKFILSHSGKQHAYHVAYALYKLDLLEKFYTSGYINNDRIRELALNFEALRFLNKRFHSELPGKMVSANWSFELPELILARFYGINDRVREAVVNRDITFDRWLSTKLSKFPDHIFWGFQGSCMESLVRGNDLGMTTASLTRSLIP